MAKAANSFFKWFKSKQRLRGRSLQREMDAEHRSRKLAEKIARKFQRLDTRQQRRHAAFEMHYGAVAKELDLPRKNRRKIARARAKQSLKGIAA